MWCSGCADFLLGACLPRELVSAHTPSFQMEFQSTNPFPWPSFISYILLFGVSAQSEEPSKHIWVSDFSLAPSKLISISIYCHPLSDKMQGKHWLAWPKKNHLETLLDANEAFSTCFSAYEPWFHPTSVFPTQCKSKYKTWGSCGSCNQLYSKPFLHKCVTVNPVTVPHNTHARNHFCPSHRHTHFLLTILFSVCP